MFLHIGNGYMICMSDLIAILSIGEKKECSALSFYKEKKRKIIDPDIQKTYVICRDQIYISPISAETLTKRCVSPWHNTFAVSPNEKK